ncbi:MAG: RICIN domain-containing protein [Clostridia bacterium]|nr:RICIN domain-containing protein [Clostridia bacterium]
MTKMTRMISFIMVSICVLSVILIVPIRTTADTVVDVKELKNLTMQNVKTKQYLNYDNGLLKNGTPVRVWPWDGSKEQLFDLIKIGENTYRLVTSASHKYAIDIYRGNSKLKAGQLCDIWQAGDDAIAQNIQFYDCGDGSYILRMSDNPDLALGATSAKGRVKLVKFNKNDASQKWIFKDAEGNPIDITEDEGSVKNPLTLDEDYGVAIETLIVDGKKYGSAELLKTIDGISAESKFFVELSNQNIVIDESLIQKLLTIDNYNSDIMGLAEDIEKTVLAICDYVDEYTDIRGCSKIGSLIGKGAAAWTQTLATLKDINDAKSFVTSWLDFGIEAAGLGERADILVVLYFSQLSINYGLESLSIMLESDIASGERDYNTAVQVIEAYAKCKEYFVIVEALTKDTIDSYNQKNWFEKFLEGTQDAVTDMADSVAGDLFESLKAFEDAKMVMNWVKTLNTLTEFESKSDEILGYLKDGKECKENSIAAYTQVKEKYIGSDEKTIAANGMKIAHYNDETAYWDSVVGKTLASIKNGSSYTKWYGKENVSAQAGYTGQCTWYALGRFYEVTGVKLTTAPHAKYWLTRNKNNKKVVIYSGASNIVAKTIAVDDDGTYGHVMFIEYVSYDIDGNPMDVYFTECNWDGNGKYNTEKDCIVKKMSYKDFIKKRSPDGYIAAK